MTTQFCYGHIRGQRPGQRIGLIKYLDSGYYPCTGDVADVDRNIVHPDTVDAVINGYNRDMGISEEVREGMEAGSMFGWRCPAAIPALKHFGAPEIDPEEEKKLHPVPPPCEHVWPCAECSCFPSAHEDPYHRATVCRKYIPAPEWSEESGYRKCLKCGATGVNHA